MSDGVVSTTIRLTATVHQTEQKTQLEKGYGTANADERKRKKGAYRKQETPQHARGPLHVNKARKA